MEGCCPLLPAPLPPAAGPEPAAAPRRGGGFVVPGCSGSPSSSSPSCLPSSPPSLRCPLPHSSPRSLLCLPVPLSLLPSPHVSPFWVLPPPFSSPAPPPRPLNPLTPIFHRGPFALPGQSAVTPRQPPRRGHRTPPWAHRAPSRGRPGPRDPPRDPRRAASPASPSPRLSSKLRPSCLLLLPFISWRARAAKGTACGQRSRASTR